MRAPDFWWRAEMGGALAPLAAIYEAVANSRLRVPGAVVGVPVICLGNLTVGGGGKTPAALAVGHLLLNARERVFFLSRGYGGRLRGPLRVDRGAHSAADVGDEPLMLARLAPTIIARDRLAGARLAQREGASVIVMDDGFQNPALAKNLAILLLDGRRGIGNGRVIPAGPLRAGLDAQIAKAQALVTVGSEPPAEPVMALARQHGLAIFRGSLVPGRASLAALGRRRVLAFAGIADPEKFFATLSAAGVNVAERVGFADHHRYTGIDAERLIARAEADQLVLLTTEKDLVRLGGEPPLAALKARATALPVELVIEEGEAFRALLLGALNRRSGGASVASVGAQEPRA
jgi:tetraacyldisaccharide 4'-kinase